MTFNFRIFLILTIICVFFNLKPSFTQDKLFVKAGFGIPELINAGIRYQLQQFQFGVYVGAYPEDGTTITGDIAWHFAGKTKFSSRKPWFIKTGITHIRNESEDYISNYDYLNLKFGRDFNLSKRFGLELDFGTSFLVNYSKTRKEPIDDWIDSGSDTNLIYGMGVGLYYIIL